MPKLEFFIGDYQINVEFEDPNDAGLITQSIVTGFEETARKKSLAIRDVYPVESQSQPGTFHPVVHFGNGVFACDCKGFQNRGYCRHTVEALEMHRAKYRLTG